MKTMLKPVHLRHETIWTIVGPLGPEVPPHLLTHSVLGVDGGAHFTKKLDLWVGDADSFEKDVPCAHVYRHPKEKDRSDLSLALAMFGECLLYDLHFWGFSGGRFDHEMFNLGEILTFLKDHPESEASLYNEKGLISLSLLGAGDWKFEHQGIFSIGSLETVKVQMTGDCRYPITQQSRLFPLSSFGLSNEAHGTIILKTDGPVFVYYPEGK